MSYNPNLTSSAIKLTGTTSGTIGIAASAITATYSLVLPAAQGGVNTVLLNDGFGSLSWAPFNAEPYRVDLFTLSPTDITNKFVNLTFAPDTAVDTILTVVGGPMQSYGADYTVSGSQLSWSGLFLDGVLTSGDMLVVQYN